MSGQQTRFVSKDILIVDDAPANLRLLSQMLTKYGYKVRAVVSGTRALEAVQMSIPDLILLDIMMPGLSGYEVCEQLKTDEKNRDIPIIFISALDAAGDKIRAFTAGGVDYITKPFHAEEVLARVETHLALRELSMSLEAQVAARTAEIIAEKEKSDAILRSAGDAIAMTDLEMRIQYVNAAFTTLTGYTAQEVIEQPIRMLVAEESPIQELKSLQLAIEKGEDWQGEITSLRKDGRTYDAALTAAPMHDAEGQLVGHVVSHRDISRHKYFERAKTQFITNVSHQLRTPIATLQLYAHLVQQTELAETNRNHLQMMDDEITRLTHLVQDMLEMANLDSGQAMTVWEPVSLFAIVENAVSCYEDRVKTNNLTIVTDPPPPDLPLVKGDEPRLVQALEEIMGNAITFVPSGGIVTIKVGTAEHKNRTWVTVSVRDTGPGIPTEELDKVFDRFFRGKLVAPGHIQGTGLGLSIAQAIVHSHGGHITVESQVGVGSTFTIWLLAAE